MITGAEEQTDVTELSYSLSSLWKLARKKFCMRGVPLNRPPYKTEGTKIADGDDKLEKGQAATNFQLRSGHSPLRHYLSRAKAGISPLCPNCVITEPTAHFLFNCKKYSKQKRKFRDRLRKEGIKVDFHNASRLLTIFPFLADDYIEDTNRFPNLRKCTPTIEAQ
ncbi:hypothetical protein CROQUDRAFT_103889 [Cronartium quercuum f. sp. fusiforme G11]|uniref:Reverse transcriptase zinc-binding domain-containing protein n=1 Tax=Cronartium quercuum f. sp. fusiforme G11 TaxID=708437 RepID=A0A9P6NX52_9BASI|nr:hypothetical protein CROQUDRAFT_103889 [Cronartium quercuum f. sp. fusiforme G11]